MNTDKELEKGKGKREKREIQRRDAARPLIRGALFHFPFSLFLMLLGTAMVSAQAKPPAAAPPRERVDLIVSGGTVVTMDAGRRVMEDGAMAVRGDAIVAMGSRAEIAARYTAARRINAAGRIVMPGLVNGHGHAPMVLMRGLADDLTLQDWLTRFIFPAEARNVKADYVEWGTRLALAEMIRSGTTTYADMYYFEDVIARVTKEAGMRGVLGETILDFPAPDNKTLPQALAYTEDYLKRWKGDPLIHAAVAPHSAYLLSEQGLRATAALARKYGAPLLIHLAETKKEIGDVREKQGESPVAYLDRIGFLGPDVLAAHCVWVDAADIALLKKNDVGCVHNPSSNMKLSSGAAPVMEMIEAGVRLGLGTDGLWYSFVIASAVEGLLKLYWFQRGKWKTRRV